MNGDTMSNAELITTLREMIKRAANSDSPVVRYYGAGLADALRLIEGKDLCEIECNLFDVEEVHENCTVQVLRNTITGATSVGWFPNDEYIE